MLNKILVFVFCLFFGFILLANDLKKDNFKIILSIKKKPSKITRKTRGLFTFKTTGKHAYYQCKFDELNQYREDNDPYIIKAPKLTVEEIRALNKILPKKDGIVYGIDEINNSDFNKAIEEYAEVYQYFPQFTEVFY